MKKYFVLLCFILCADAGVLKADNSNSLFEEMNSIMSNDDMVLVTTGITAHYCNEGIWLGRDAQIWRNKRDGSYWVKIFIFASPGYVRCRVEKNPDYTTGLASIKGGYRTRCQYKVVGNGITYYFNF